jgi:3-oxoacyl-[acyl-carrier-protein] synthase II
MNGAALVDITACAWELPAYAGHATLPRALQETPDAGAVFDPASQLGKKGLRYKETATLMALCVAKKALQRAGLESSVADPHCGVVVACNTGNLDTVCRVAQTIQQAHVSATSSMDLPNASSNVVASTVAIRFGLQALNMLVTSGANASVDALLLAANAIRNGRAERMLVISVETDGPALRDLLAGGRGEGGDTVTVLEGALAVVMESGASAAARGAPCLGRIGECAFLHAKNHTGLAPPDLQALLVRHHDKTLYPGTSAFARCAIDAAGSAAGMSVVDIDDVDRRAYGSAGLLQLVHHLERQTCSGAVLVSGGNWGDQRASLLVIEGRPA